MSTSPPCSFFDAEASAASTAWKTISRSTLFSREIASTSINSSRFIGFDLRQPLRSARAPLVRGALRGGEPAPLEIDHRDEARLAHLVEGKVQHLLFAGGFGRRGAVPAAAARACAERLAACFLRRGDRGGRREQRGASRVSAAISSPRKRLRPLNGTFSVTSTCSPRKRRKSAAFFSGRSSPGDETSSRS